jgi:hypothetical protein
MHESIHSFLHLNQYHFRSLIYAQFLERLSAKPAPMAADHAGASHWRVALVLASVVLFGAMLVVFLLQRRGT